MSLKAEISGQYASAIGAQRLLYDLLVSRRLDPDAKKAERNGWGYRRGTARRSLTVMRVATVKVRINPESLLGWRAFSHLASLTT